MQGFHILDTGDNISSFAGQVDVRFSYGYYELIAKVDRCLYISLKSSLKPTCCHCVNYDTYSSNCAPRLTGPSTDMRWTG